jgi:hypothetical protein
MYFQYLEKIWIILREVCVVSIYEEIPVRREQNQQNDMVRDKTDSSVYSPISFPLFLREDLPSNERSLQWRWWSVEKHHSLCIDAHNTDLSEYMDLWNAKILI